MYCNSLPFDTKYLQEVCRSPYIQNPNDFKTFTNVYKPCTRSLCMNCNIWYFCCTFGILPQLDQNKHLAIQCKYFELQNKYLQIFSVRILIYNSEKEDISEEDISEEDISEEDTSEEDISEEDFSEEDISEENISEEDIQRSLREINI